MKKTKAHKLIFAGEHEPPGTFRQSGARTAGSRGLDEVTWIGVTILNRSLPIAAGVAKTGAMPTRPPGSELRDLEEFEPTGVGPRRGTPSKIQLGGQDSLVRRRNRR